MEHTFSLEVKTTKIFSSQCYISPKWVSVIFNIIGEFHLYYKHTKKKSNNSYKNILSYFSSKRKLF